MNRAIPGYYYDEEKKKYFKIEKSHTAPASASWSADNVKRRKIEKKTTKAKEHRANLTRKHIKRSPVLEDPRLGGLLNRELGISTPGIKGLALTASREAGIWAAVGERRSKDSPLPGWGRQAIGCFWVHPKPAKWRTVMVSNGDSPWPPLNLFFGPAGGSCRPVQASLENWLPTASGVHSMSYCRGQDLLLMGSNYGSPKVRARKPLAVDTPGTAGLFARNNRPTDVEATFRRPLSDRQVLHQVTASYGPGNHRYAGAVGARGLLGIIDSDLVIDTRLIPQENTDVLSQTFMDSMSEALMAGTRSGWLYQIDLRVDPRKPVPAAHLGPRRSVAHMAQVSPYEVVAAGPGSMAIYDVRRFPAGGSAAEAHPVVRFSEFYNTAKIHFGFAVNRDWGLVATNDDQGVGIFSSATGQKLSCKGVQGFRASTMQFDDDGTLWMSSETEPVITRYNIK